MSTTARLIYRAVGAVVLALAGVALLKPSAALPPDAYSALSAHLVQEQGAMALFLGFLALAAPSFSIHSRRMVHLAFLIFTLVFSLLHWTEFFAARRHLVSPLANSIPFVLFVLLTPFVFRAESTERTRPTAPDGG
jgi:ABC-type uncharacterized transport system permease subunit